jgi:hypothetical protein
MIRLGLGDMWHLMFKNFFHLLLNFVFAFVFWVLNHLNSDFLFFFTYPVRLLFTFSNLFYSL